MSKEAFNSSEYPYHTLLENLGHRLIRDESGVDIFRLDAGYHNGPECELCGEKWCHHCQPNAEPCEKAIKGKKAN